MKRTRSRRLAWALAVLCAGAACTTEKNDAASDGGTSSASDRTTVMLADAVSGDRICQSVEACGGICTYNYDLDGILISPRCAETAETASCTEHLSEKPDWEKVCFPPCTKLEVRCNQDETVTICSPYMYGVGDLRWITFSCAALCEEENDRSGEPLRYTGKCSSKDNSLLDETSACHCE